MNDDAGGAAPVPQDPAPPEVGDIVPLTGRVVEIYRDHAVVVINLHKIYVPLADLHDAAAANETERLRAEVDVERRQRQAYAAQIDRLTQHPDDLASALLSSETELAALRAAAGGSVEPDPRRVTVEHDDGGWWLVIDDEPHRPDPDPTHYNVAGFVLSAPLGMSSAEAVKVLRESLAGPAVPSPVEPAPGRTQDEPCTICQGAGCDVCDWSGSREADAPAGPEDQQP